MTFYGRIRIRNTGEKYRTYLTKDSSVAEPEPPGAEPELKVLVGHLIAPYYLILTSAADPHLTI